MSTIIRIPTPLRGYAGGQSDVAVDAMTVGEALQAVAERYPQLRRHLYSDNGELRNFVNVYVNEDDVRYLDSMRTPVREGDTVTIVPSIAGGGPESARDDLPTPELTQREILRYSRHLIMPEVGMDGQRKLKAAKVLLVGSGGLGSPLGLYLAAAGVGTLGVVDFDVVDESNLQRQVLYGARDRKSVV